MESLRHRRLEHRKTPLTEKINEFISLYYNGRLTQPIVRAWLKTKLTEDEKKQAIKELEEGLSDTIENLPLK